LSRPKPTRVVVPIEEEEEYKIKAIILKTIKHKRPYRTTNLHSRKVSLIKHVEILVY
jgi:hypothetical protein